MQIFRTMDADIAAYNNRGRQAVAIALQQMRYEKPGSWLDPSAAGFPPVPNVEPITKGMDNDLAVYFSSSPLFEENAVAWQRMRYKKPAAWVDPSVTTATAAVAAPAAAQAAST